MSVLEILAVLGVGVVAGTMNTIVGSGSLVTFPTLLAFGFPALVANVSNTLGLVPGSLSGAVAYRRELAGQARRVALLGTMSAIGGTGGAMLLLELPGSVFHRVIPWLILLACALVAVQPRVARWLAGRGARRRHGGPGLFAAVLATGVYGGYFGAAQGVILVALLGISIEDSLQRLNGAKNVLAAIANGCAAIVFVAASHISYEAAGLIAAGSTAGGQLGGHVGRKLSPRLLRGIIVVVGTAVAITLLA
ncbi:MAG TPA: sulfite exporter TauE/SafE family protein [Acidimicrobiales bacterium]|nr:sulfite exporter TauE/SafE family protein [Acidimicrobiales bacterium]